MVYSQLFQTKGFVQLNNYTHVAIIDNLQVVFIHPLNYWVLYCLHVYMLDIAFLSLFVNSTIQAFISCFL